jgi:hypothetical protein
MIGGRGHQALDPLCVSASNGCGATFTDPAHELPAARGPPPTFEPRDLSPGRYGHRADCNSRQT